MSDLVSELQQVMSRFDSCSQFSERTTLISVYTFHLWYEQIKYSFQRVNGPLYQFLFDNVNTTGFEGSVLRDMPTEVYCTRANTLPVREVWMVNDVYGKIKGMKID